MTASDISLRLVTEPDDPAIAAFGELQERAYFEPDALIPAAYIGRLLTMSTPGRRNFLLIAESGGEVVGGTVFHFFAGPNTGFSSFMAVAPEFRGRGLARKLHEKRFETLDAAAGREVVGVFIDVVNPARLTPKELAAEKAVCSDPVARRRIFGRLGFRQVGARYVQPLGGPEGGPITNMDLLFCPRLTADSVPLSVVLGTMRAYWLPWLGEKRTERALRDLEEQANGNTLPLLPTLPE